MKNNRNMKIKAACLLAGALTLSLTACTSAEPESLLSEEAEAEGESGEESPAATEAIAGSDSTEAAGEEAGTEAANTEDAAEPILFSFVDAHGETYTAELQEDWDETLFSADAISRDESGAANYTSADGSYTTLRGIDVSKFQGEIDWSAVKEAGYQFAFIRIGFRGYGNGSLNTDDYARSNLKGATEAGLMVGVYFFSQAISEEEAIEEADYVTDLLAGWGYGPEALAMPIVYDPESILTDDSRTDSLTGEQATANTLTFCSAVEAAGYSSMVYTNMVWEATMLDLAQIYAADIPVWYADYEARPQTPYRYSMWQYSETTSVPGIDAACDADLWFVPAE